MKKEKLKIVKKFKTAIFISARQINLDSSLLGNERDYY